MKKYGWLRNFCLLELFRSALKHDISDGKTKNVVSRFEKYLCFLEVVVKVFAHSWKLGSLARENICVHTYQVWLIMTAKLEE